MNVTESNSFREALRRRNDARPPVWFMRQAGRYHSHYQRLRAANSFIDLCRKPELATEVTFGPIDDFGFDAAILFSDLLFPLEALGMGLRYEPGPVLDWHLRSPADLNRLEDERQPGYFNFQAEAMRRIRARLNPNKGLIGFVGAPLTLYFYAVEGSHQNLDRTQPQSAVAGIADGRFDGFCERLLDLVADEMAVQAKAGADTIAMFDTCAGEVDPLTYRSRVVPALRALLERFERLAPGVPVTYYSKGTGPMHWDALKGLPIACLGVDWNHDITGVLREYGEHFAIQGNIDPSWLFLPPIELERRLREVFARVAALPEKLKRGWICGLGHGVLQKTPEDNVRLFLKVHRETFE